MMVACVCVCVVHPTAVLAFNLRRIFNAPELLQWAGRHGVEIVALRLGRHDATPRRAELDARYRL